jgi:GAF domain-containing protein
MHTRRSFVVLAFYLGLLLIFLYLTIFRPPIAFYALPLAPIALAAVLYGFAGGTLVALAAMAGVAVLIALDPDAVRRATTLHEAWPILSMYLIVGPVVGWLAVRERERERRLVSAARRLHVVQEISQVINTSLDLEQILDTIIAETGRLVAFQRAAVLLKEGGSLRVVAAHRDRRRRPAEFVGQTFTLREAAAGWALEHGQVWRGGPEAVARHPDTRQLCPPQASCLAVPLQFQREMVGVFMLGGEGVQGLSRASLDNLVQIASQVAIAIQHARLFESERQRASQLAAVGDAGREIAASLDLDRILRLVMAKAVETLPMDAGALFQFDAQSQAYRVAVSHDLSADHVAQITFAFDEGVPGWVVKHRQALIIPNVAADERCIPTWWRTASNPCWPRLSSPAGRWSGCSTCTARPIPMPLTARPCSWLRCLLTRPP